MYTLGLWGFSADRPKVTFHDTGAALVKDGQLLAAINEERISRVKIDNGFPFGAIEEILAIAAIDYADIDQVAFAGQPATIEMRGKARTCWQEVIRPGNHISTRVSMFGRSYQFLRRSSPILASRFHHRRVPPKPLQRCPVHWVAHHHSHAATAYLCSPFERAVILSLDGSDSAGGAGLVGIGEADKGMYFVESTAETHSLALLYGRITELLGFKALRHEGKVLGLAAFDDPAKLRSRFDANGYWNERTGWWDIPGFVMDVSRKKHPHLDKLFKGESREAVAAALQDFVEELICKKVQRIYRDHPDWAGLPLVLAGGLFANVKLNQRILELPEVSNIYIHQNMGDAGLCTGAALYADAKSRGDWKPRYLPHVYLGTKIEREAARQACAQAGFAYEDLRETDLVERIATALAEGKVLARADGGMEYGPRALGNRSILARADDPTINQWLNDQLQRSEFMPFAPMVMAEHAREYFPDYRDDHYAARFMTITYNASERAKKEIPAAIHIDGTARPQVVYKQDNPQMHAILCRYYEKTGIPAVINTSFNMHEEPIVRTAGESLSAAVQARLDGLVLGGLYVDSPAAQAANSDRLA